MLVFSNKYFLNKIPKFLKDHFSLVYDVTFKNLGLKQNREISIVFIDNKISHNINKKYRHKDYPTDVISFAFDEGEEEIKIKNQIHILGEIFINIEKAKQQASSYGHSEKREFCFLFLHGLLHILGYNHKLENERKIMFGLQKKILQECNINRTNE